MVRDTSSRYERSKSGSPVDGEPDPPAKKRWSGDDTVDPAFSGRHARDSRQPIAAAAKVTTRPGSNLQRGEWKRIVPLLGHLVAGAERCAVLSFDSINRQLGVEAATNLSPEFINTLAGNREAECLIAAVEKAKPHLVIYLPGNKDFRFLREPADKESIRTLWLVPCRDQKDNVFGALLFASDEVLSPSKETYASVMLFATLISAALSQTGGEEMDEEPNVFSADSEPRVSRISIEDHAITAVQDLIREWAKSWQGNRPVEPDFPAPSSFGTRRNSGTSILRMGKDKHGIPVLYDSSMHERREHADPDVISVLSHELLSPLTLIKGYSATLLELDSAITSEQKRRYLRGIESATNRVIRLLENLRDITRLEESDSLVLQPTSLPHLLRQIVSEIQSQATNHVMKFRARGTIPMVRVDQQKIEQVMTNLLLNAVKYSPQRGDIETTVTLVQDEHELNEVCGQSPALRLPCVVVSVSDSGIGIPEAELEKIFHRFYRVDNRLTRSTPGAGLGLYICQVIVEAHNGRIWARNKPSEGSILSFSLPVD